MDNSDTLCPDKQNTNTREYWAVFVQTDCAACPLLANCPVQGKRERRLTWSREKLATSQRQKETQTKEFKEKHKIRSGIEATNSELKHKHGGARLTVRGYARIELALTFKTLALNIKRMFLYVLAQLQQSNSDGTCKTVAAVVCAFASVLLVFIGFARLNRQKTYYALKSMDFGMHPFPGTKVTRLYYFAAFAASKI